MLVKKTYGREYTRTFREAIRREWVIGNGTGTYAGSSLIGANTRKHHGLLIASMHAPTERKVILSRIREEISFPGKEICLSSAQKNGDLYEEGYLYQTGFSFDAVPEFTCFVNGLLLKKTVALEWERNTVAVLYEIENRGEDAAIHFSPVFNFRDHNESGRKENLSFESVLKKDRFELTPKDYPQVRISCFFSMGNAYRIDCFDKDTELQTETDTGMSSDDIGYVPYKIDVSVSSGKKVVLSVICSLEDAFEKNAEVTIRDARTRAEKLLKRAGVSHDEFLSRLVVNADNFIVKRASTGGKTILAGLPWFTDWGRDTMISLTGLTLETKRFDDAASILETFARYEKNGIIPNMFPDDGVEPLYNTADASLWYFYCVYQYLNYSKTKKAEIFVRKKIYPCLKKIISAYLKGTDYSIYTDVDGLVHAGSDLDQVTWMDVRTNGYVVTPRHGKPVEINALWYNAVRVSQWLAEKFSDAEFEREMFSLSEKIKKSFCERFWNERENCLYDVVDETERDGVTVSDNGSIRPNQIFAVSLPFSMLDREKEKAVVQTVLQKLYTDFGLRTLSCEHSDYHGKYEGSLWERDMAYHQGTAWAFLLGAFVSAYLKVCDYSKEAKEFTGRLLEPMKKHLDDGCIGGIAEVFDGDAPHVSHGCYTQAWSVGEIIRAYGEKEKL